MGLGGCYWCMEVNCDMWFQTDDVLTDIIFTQTLCLLDGLSRLDM